MLDEFRDAVRDPKPYYLCIGGCYVLTVKSDCEKLFDLPVHYINYQGASSTGLYCYSLLENCRGVFFFSTWANLASVATTKYFHHWRKILDELLMIGCPVIMVEAPLSQEHYRHPGTTEGITIVDLDLKRATYVHEVIGAVAHPSLIYQDMVDIVGYSSKYLVDQHPTKTPWHLSNIAVKKVTRYFIKTMVTGRDNSEILLVL